MHVTHTLYALLQLRQNCPMHFNLSCSGPAHASDWVTIALFQVAVWGGSKLMVHQSPPAHHLHHQRDCTRRGLWKRPQGEPTSSSTTAEGIGGTSANLFLTVIKRGSPPQSNHVPAFSFAASLFTCNSLKTGRLGGPWEQPSSIQPVLKKEKIAEEVDDVETVVVKDNSCWSTCHPTKRKVGKWFRKHEHFRHWFYFGQIWHYTMFSLYMSHSNCTDGWLQGYFYPTLHIWSSIQSQADASCTGRNGFSRKLSVHPRNLCNTTGACDILELDPHDTETRVKGNVCASF